MFHNHTHTHTQIDLTKQTKPERQLKRDKSSVSSCHTKIQQKHTCRKCLLENLPHVAQTQTHSSLN